MYFIKKGFFLQILILAMLFGTATLSRAAEDMDNNMTNHLETATFAGGCFWCMQSDFDKVDGVVKTTVGYTGGDVENPTYKQVSSGKTGHVEAIQIEFDPKKISYEQLLQIFWHNIDPLSPAKQGQFCDVGDQYRSEIFYHNEQQKEVALKSKKELDESGRFDQPIQTTITPAETFYPAEEYHQAYYKKNPARYKVYRYFCGRDKRLNELWVKPSK
jgi:peptide-methionine (S)-S-oxide reductase